MKKRRTYYREFKQMVVALAKTREDDISGLAAEFDLRTELINRWKWEALANLGASFPGKGNRTASNQSFDNQRLSDPIKEIYQLNKKTYGSPRITIKLQEEGYHVSRPRVVRMMKKLGLKSIIRNKWIITTDSRHKFQLIEINSIGTSICPNNKMGGCQV